MKPPENCKPLDGLKNCIIGIFAAHDKGPVQRKCADIAYSITAFWASLSKIEDANIRDEVEREIAAAIFKAIDLGAAVDWRHHKERKARIARDGRQPIVAARRMLTVNAVAAEVRAKNLTLAISNEFADSIKLGVSARLREQPDTRQLTTTSAIKNAVRELKSKAE